VVDIFILRALLMSHCSFLGEELATLIVGPQKKWFIVHKKLLCDTVDFFQKAFMGPGRFKEGGGGVMELPEDNARAFSLFVEWAYKSNLTPCRTRTHCESLFELYFFAEKICLPKLKDKVIDEIQTAYSLH
jgi:hypothetical protein